MHEGGWSLLIHGGVGLSVSRRDSCLEVMDYDRGLSFQYSQPVERKGKFQHGEVTGVLD